MSRKYLANQSIIPSAVIGIIGAVFLCVSAFKGLQYKELAEHGLKAVAVVTDVTSHRERSSKGHSKTVYESTLQFVDASGGQRTHQVKRRFAKGESVVLLYSPTDQSNVFVGSLDELWLEVLIFSGVAALALIAAGFLYWRMRKRQNEIDYLLERGIRVNGEVVGVNTHTARRRRGIRTVTYTVDVRATHPVTGVSQNLRSDPLNDEPVNGAGSTVQVCFHPEHERSYFIDTSALW